MAESVTIARLRRPCSSHGQSNGQGTWSQRLQRWRYRQDGDMAGMGDPNVALR